MTGGSDEGGNESRSPSRLRISRSHRVRGSVYLEVV